MYGEASRHDLAQLATLDAMVFFSIALLVSSVLLSYGIGSVSYETTAPARDPSEILEVFMRSSIGSEISLTLDRPLVIQGREQVGECLMIELDGLIGGSSQQPYGPLNLKLSGIMEAICGPSLNYLLSIARSGSTELMHLGDVSVPEARDVFASSMEIHSADGSSLLEVLAVRSCAF